MGIGLFNDGQLVCPDDYDNDEQPKMRKKPENRQLEIAIDMVAKTRQIAAMIDRIEILEDF